MKMNLQISKKWAGAALVLLAQTAMADATTTTTPPPAPETPPVQVTQVIPAWDFLLQLEAHAPTGCSLAYPDLAKYNSSKPSPVKITLTAADGQKADVIVGPDATFAMSANTVSGVATTQANIDGVEVKTILVTDQNTMSFIQIGNLTCGPAAFKPAVECNPSVDGSQQKVNIQIQRGAVNAVATIDTQSNGVNLHSQFSVNETKTADLRYAQYVGDGLTFSVDETTGQGSITATLSDGSSLKMGEQLQITNGQAVNANALVPFSCQFSTAVPARAAMSTTTGHTFVMAPSDDAPCSPHDEENCHPEPSGGLYPCKNGLGKCESGD